MPTPQKKSWSRHIPDGAWDYIVIGSGMGGMTAAAILAKLGKRVLVLEQHYVPGGFTHTFKRKKWVWDVGVHAVGEVTTHSMTGRILHAVTDGELQWNSLGEVYDEFHYPDGFRIDFPDTPKKFRQNLIDAFPDETEAIDAYLAQVREVASAMKGYYLARTTPKGVASKAADLFLGRKAERFLQERTA
ncbi:MAG: NAD(P)-binding protein, partial [Myxococcota bacterium]